MLAGLCGCDRAPPESTVAAAPPHFPVRGLGEVGPAPAAPAVIDENFDTLDGWWALADHADGRLTLLPAGASPDVVLHEHRVTLPENTALLTFVPLREWTPYSLRVRMNGPQAAPGQPCPQLMLLAVHTRGAMQLARGETPAPDEVAALASLLAQSAAASPAWWLPETESELPEARLDRGLGDVTGPGTEAATETETETETMVLVAIDAWGGELQVEHVSLQATLPLRHGYDPSSEIPASSDELAIEGIKLSGEWRPSALVPAGKKLLLPVNVPEGAVDVLTGVCPEPGAGVGDSCSWSVTLRPGGQLLAEATEHVVPDRAPCFVDHILPWPADVQGPVTIEFAVEGARGMIFGQPRVRGPESPDAPSLLFVSIDTLRADHLGFLGYGRPTTPYLDELARHAAVFTDVTAAASYTLPAHATMFTGLFPPRHMALDTGDRLDADRTPTLARYLADAGFHAAGFTGGGLVSVDYGFAAGFDRYTTVDPVAIPPFITTGADGSVPDSAQIRQARENNSLDDVGAWIALQGRRRWFAFVHTFATHEYDPPDEDRVLFERVLDVSPDFNVQARLKPQSVATDPPTRAELDRLIDLYDATIHHVDRRFGRLLESLRRDHLLDHTIVVVTSDHGEEFLEHGRLRHYGSLYQELVHVPLLISLPGDGPGLRLDVPVSQADLLPTLLELLGVPVPAGLDGRSLAPLLAGAPEPGAPTPLFGNLDLHTHGRSALRQGDWKIIHADTSAYRVEPARAPWEFYNLRSDPQEQRDLSGEELPELGRMQGLIGEIEASLAARRGVRRAATPDEEVRRRLIELGYIEAAR